MYLYMWMVECRVWVILPWPQPSGNPVPTRPLPPLPHPVPSSPPLSHLTPSWEIKHIRSFKKLLKLQSEFKMSSFHPVFSGKYYILNISLLWSLFEPFNFYNLSRGMYFKIISFYIHVLKPLAKVFWLIQSHRWDLFHCVAGAAQLRDSGSSSCCCCCLCCILLNYTTDRHHCNPENN
jgi:hypothetical protein